MDNFTDKINCELNSKGFVIHDHRIETQPNAADKVFEEMKQRESENQVPPLRHSLLTYRDKPGWGSDAYQFPHPLRVRTYFVVRTFRPDGKIYDTVIMKGLEWDEWIGCLEHWELTEQLAEKVVVDPDNKNIITLSIEDKDKYTIEELVAKYKDSIGFGVIHFVPDSHPDCTCCDCDKEAGIDMKTV